MRPPGTREIIYVNADDFYASVARLRDSALTSRPVIIGHLSNRGSVIAASYEARDDGVRPGLAMPQARRLCPRASFIQIDWPLFRRASRALFSVVRQYSPLVEPVRLEEGFIDYTGCAGLFGVARDTARRVQRELAGSMRLKVSFGLGSNKLTSQVASRAAKRMGIVDVPAGQERAFLEPFPISWLPGVQSSQAKILVSLGIKTIGGLAQVPPALAGCVLGPFGSTLVERAGGRDNRPVRSGEREEILEEGVTFPSDLVDRSCLDAHLYRLCEALGRRLRRQGRGAKRLRLRLCYTDGDEAAGGGRLGRPSHSDRDLYDQAEVLLGRAYTRRVKVRALYLAAVRPQPVADQLDLFQFEGSQLGRLYRACDTIRRKYQGEKILRLGRTLAIGEDEAFGSGPAV